MRFLRNHWFDIGFIAAIIIGAFLLISNVNGMQLLLCINLIALFLHQFEEYRFPGYFPEMLNSVMFSSTQPDRFPLNSNSALIVNLTTGWLFYSLAAIFAENAIWLGIATMMVSSGNFIGHTFIFNIKGRTLYNPGMLTSVILFLPISVYFFYLVIRSGSATPLVWIAGIILGIVLNYIGVLKLVEWFKNRNTSYVFPRRNIKSDD